LRDNAPLGFPKQENDGKQKKQKYPEAFCILVHFFFAFFMASFKVHPSRLRISITRALNLRKASGNFFFIVLQRPLEVNPSCGTG
jgi:hypothetical protein